MKTPVVADGGHNNDRVIEIYPRAQTGTRP